MRPSHRPTRAGGGRRWIAPALLAVGALVATALTLVSAGPLPASVVDGLARAVGGCDSLLEVDRSGTINVFSEERGGAIDPVGSCGAVAPGERDDVEVGSVVIADASGEALEIDDRDRGSMVTVGGWRATVLGRVEVEPGPYLVRGGRRRGRGSRSRPAGGGISPPGNRGGRDDRWSRLGGVGRRVVEGRGVISTVRCFGASVISVWDPPSGPRLG